MITREQVADLQPGDVVELRDERHPGFSVTALLRKEEGDVGRLRAGPFIITAHPVSHEAWSLTVVSRAPRPLYVNHDRTKPVPGDVVRDADHPDDQRTWMYGASVAHGVIRWECGFLGGRYTRRDLPARLRLLVDGETGMPPAVTP